MNAGGLTPAVTGREVADRDRAGEILERFVATAAPLQRETS